MSHGQKKHGQLGAALLFLLPHAAGLLLFTVLPILATFAISLMNWNMITPPRFVGFQNYADMFTADPFFWQAMENTVLYTAGSAVLIVGCSLLAALLIHAAPRFQGLFRTLYFVPNVSSLVAVAVVWAWIYNGDYGLLNNALRMAGFANPPDWLSNTHFALLSVIFMSAWTQIGFFVVIFLAGLQGIPRQLYEAAAIDGSSAPTTLRHITLPLLSPTTFFVLVMVLINSFQVFEQAYVMTKGGPAFSTTTAVMYIYNSAFQNQKMGYASAVSWVLFACILVVTAAQLALQKKWVYYETQD